MTEAERHGGRSVAESVVIVGAGGGGDAVAMGLRKQGFEGPVTLIGDERQPPYERPHLSKQFLRGEVPEEKVSLRPAGEYERNDIEVLLGRRVVGGDTGKRRVRVDTGDELPFSHLVLATGAKPRELPGAPAGSNIFTLRSLSDAEALRTAVLAANRVLLVGAGFIGAEIAASARTMGKEVIMVEAGRVPLERVLGPDLGEYCAKVHRDRGVDLHTGATVHTWHMSGDRVEAASLSDGARVELDIVVIAIGVAPNIELAEILGLPVSPAGVETDETLQAEDGIFAIGDIAAHFHPVYGRRMRVEHWQVAQRQGTAVASSIVSGPQPYTELPWFWSDQYDVNLQYLGNAVQTDQTVLRGTMDTGKFSVFYLWSEVIQAVLSVNDGKTGRLSRPLIRDRVPVPAEALSDPTSDLRGLAGAVQS